MCGRFTLAPESRELIRELNLVEFPDNFVPRYNIAPTQPVATIRDITSRKVEWLHWGLIPSWAKDPRIGLRMINARSETLLEKPSFRDAFLKRRCLILADGFYEWQKHAGKEPSSPFYFFLKDHQPFFFAGLWDQWRSESGELLETCALITGSPNELVSPIHDRMPIILDPQNCWDWISPSTTVETLRFSFHPYSAEKMSAYPVSTLINQSGLETPDLVKQI